MNAVGRSDPAALARASRLLAGPAGGVVYVAPAGYEGELAHELGADALPLGHRLWLAPGPSRRPAWVDNEWLSPRLVPIASIGDAARQLRALGRNWTLHPAAEVRRSRLIEAKLPALRPKPLRFPAPPPAAPLGAFALLGRETLLASARTSSPVPHGHWRFEEDRAGPPARAYLKLWEALTRLGEHPRPGELCLDLGASPGGWSWVAAELGAEVVSVDKAPLVPALAERPEVTYRQGSAFAVDPRELGPVDWLLCDVVCYPRRLHRLVSRWLDAGTARRMVCTVKLQGVTDHGAVQALAAVPGSALWHLSHNKHELCWVYRQDPSA